MHPILEMRCRCKGTFAVRKNWRLKRNSMQLNAHGRLHQCILVNAPRDDINESFGGGIDACLGNTWRSLIDLTWRMRTVYKFWRLPTMLQLPPPSTYALGERVGNVSRGVALVPASLMDFNDVRLPESNVCDLGFTFQCELEKTSHHKAEGYRVKIVVISINSDISLYWQNVWYFRL